MTYQVLARKWRPRNFQQMVGQEHVLRMLTNALDQQRLHHAYLFTGTRGVGKTTLARILAKCLNCETGITSNPCGTCTNCTAIDSGRFLDLMEIDAASRTKVEDTRELLDNVQYQPVEGRYKVYLIDEVHMLSGHSFNALLKTLEEPPAHVKFLLATTDPKRLPITILSRCLQFNLKRVLPQQIAAHLLHICKTENLPHEETALELLANAADGSMRDALSLLDQTIAFCGDTITTTSTREMLGTIEQDALYRLLDALANHDGKQLLAEIKHLTELAADFNQVLEDLLSILHRISLLQIIPDVNETNTPLSQLANQLSAEEIQLYYQIALIGRRDLPLTPNPQYGFEMIMMRMLAFHPVTKPTPPAAKPKEPVTHHKKTTPVASAVSATPSSAEPWSDMLSKLELTGLAHILAANCVLANMTDNKITLALSTQHQPMLNKKLSERIEQALTRYLNKPIKLDIQITENQEHATPIKQQIEEQTARQNAADEAVKNDSDLQKIMGLFDATLSSVTPRNTSFIKTNPSQEQ